MQSIPSSLFTPYDSFGFDGLLPFANGDLPLVYEPDVECWPYLIFAGLNDDGKLQVGFACTDDGDGSFEFYRVFDAAFGATSEHARCVLEGVIWPSLFSDDIERTKLGFVEGGK